MDITSRNLIDIERYTNDLREGMLSLLFGEGEEIVDKGNYGLVAHAFDRATTSALFKHLTNPQPVLEQETKTPAPMAKSKAPEKAGKSKGPGPAAGSQAARDRAAKAVATRAANKAAKEAEAKSATSTKSEPAQKETTSNLPNAPARPTSFGGTQVSPVAQVVSRGPEGN